MYLKKTIIIVVSIFWVSIVYGQTNVDYSLYSYSLNLVNPAFAGQQKNTELIVNSKMQWVGIKDAPRTSTFSLNMPFKNGLGIGFSVINDKVFVLSQTKLALDISYQLKLAETHKLQFGIKALANIYNGDINKIKTEEQNDQLFAEAINKVSPNFTIGAAITTDDYFMHLSINNILIDNKYETIIGSKKSNRLDISIGGGYSFILNNNLMLTPSTLIRVEEGAPLFFDINGVLEINKKYNIGLSYTWNNSFHINGLLPVVDWIQLGYGYRLYTNDLRTEQNGTHEFIAVLNLDNIL